MSKPTFDNLPKDKVIHLSFITGLFIVSLIYLIEFFYKLINYLIKYNVSKEVSISSSDFILPFIIFIVMFIGLLSFGRGYKNLERVEIRLDRTNIKGTVKK